MTVVHFITCSEKDEKKRAKGRNVSLYSISVTNL